MGNCTYLVNSQDQWDRKGVGVLRNGEEDVKRKSRRRHFEKVGAAKVRIAGGNVAAKAEKKKTEGEGKRGGVCVGGV